jgi:HEAT repeat protein
MKTHSTPDRLRRCIVAGFASAVIVLAASSTPLRAEAAKAAGDLNRNDAMLARCIKLLNYGEMVSIAKPSKVDAIAALGLMGDERAVGPLVEHLLNEENNNIRLQITRALGWIGSKEAVPALETALQDKYPYVRKQAAAALKDITGKDYEYDKTGLPDIDAMRKAIETAAAAARSASEKKN